MASFVCGNLHFLPGNILTSPKLRAVQTASIMGSALRNPLKPQETDGLLPGDGPSTWAERLQAYDRDLMLVGHLPHLSRLASLLLCWDPGRNIVHFPPAAIVCLSYQGGWAVRWALAPDLLKG